MFYKDFRHPKAKAGLMTHSKWLNKYKHTYLPNICSAQQVHAMPSIYHAVYTLENVLPFCTVDTISTQGTRPGAIYAIVGPSDFVVCKESCQTLYRAYL